MTTASFLRAQSLVREQSLENYAKLLYGFVQSNVSFFPEAPSILGAIRSRSWGKVKEAADSMSTVVHGSVTEHLVRNQFALLVRKYPFDPGVIPGLDPEQTAIKKFIAAERRCRRVNLRFANSNRFYKRFHRYEPYLNAARRWIRWVIGEEPPLPKIYSMCDFGPGAAIGCNGDATSLARKLLAERWTVTRSAVPYALGALWANAQVREWLLSQLHPEKAVYTVDPSLFKAMVLSKLELVEHNNISMVHKDAESMRAIASEPSLNGFLQKGAGEFIAACLRQCGQDLRNQLRNQLKARAGSIFTVAEIPYVTLDLSSASDMLALLVCKLLLPPAWFEFLIQLRVQNGRFKDGREISYSKMSSMGNGFTFPLETLIFSSICHAAAVVSGQKPDFSVYGDDIIVRQDLALIVVELLNLVGFKVNRKKSYFHGPFRESCGADWMEGVDVRPIVLDKPLSSLEELFSIHNATLRNPLVASIFTEVRPIIREMAPTEFRFLRPYPGLEDAAFEVPMDIFMAQGGGTWCADEQRWVWRELAHRAVRDFDTRWRGSATLLAIAALRGSSSEVPYALRRKTKVSVVRTTNTEAVKRDKRRAAFWRATPQPESGCGAV